MDKTVQSNVKQQGTITFTHTNRIGKPAVYGTDFEIFSLRHILLKSTKSITIDTEIEVWLPDKITAVPTVVRTIKTLKLTPYKLDHLRDLLAI